MTSTRRYNALGFMFVFALGSLHARAASVDDRGEIRRDRPFKEGIVLAASQLALESETDETSFNFARLRDLWIRVNLPSTRNPVQLNLRLIDPQGTLIYEASVLYASDPTITVFQAKTLSGGVALDYAIPVSGGVVTRNLREGTWALVAEAGGRKFSTLIDVSTGY